MAEEKESKGSYLVQIRIPVELKERLEERAAQAGVTLNHYLMYLLVKESKKHTK